MQYGEMSGSSLKRLMGMLFENMQQIRFLDIGSGSGRPTLHAALDYGDIVASSAGIEIGVNRLSVSLEILDYIRQKLNIALSHVSYILVCPC